MTLGPTNSQNSLIKLKPACCANNGTTSSPWSVAQNYTGTYTDSMDVYIDCMYTLYLVELIWDPYFYVYVLLDRLSLQHLMQRASVLAIIVCLTRVNVLPQKSGKSGCQTIDMKLEK